MTTKVYRRGSQTYTLTEWSEKDINNYVQVQNKMIEEVNVKFNLNKVTLF